MHQHTKKFKYKQTNLSTLLLKFWSAYTAEKNQFQNCSIFPRKTAFDFIYCLFLPSHNCLLLNSNVLYQ